MLRQSLFCAMQKIPRFSLSRTGTSERFYSTVPDLQSLCGFGNVFSSEAVPYSLPRNQNSPQKVPYGLYAEQLSGSAFTVPRKHNKWLWTYRLRPSVCHTPSILKRILPHPGLLPPLVYLNQADSKKCSSHNSAVYPRYCGWISPPFEIPCQSGNGKIPSAPPIQLRYKALPNVLSGNSVDFIEGIVTIAAHGDPKSCFGGATLLYCFNTSMSETVFDLSTYKLSGSSKGRYICNYDGEMLFVPFEGSLKLKIETGVLIAAPGHIAVVPRGMKFQVESCGDSQNYKGYVCENYGSPFVLPDLGPIGSSSGLANPRHFVSPKAEFEDIESGPYELVTKSQGQIWNGIIDNSPIDIVAWYGNYVPYKYDLSLFNCINSVSFDHPDPSIYTVLTSPCGSGSVGGGVPGVANIDFVVFPPRWICMENTFRPPWFHRNYMSELMGLIRGEYDAKQGGGFVPGAVSIHNSMVPHGPDEAAWSKGTNYADTSIPERYGSKDLAFMFECSGAWSPTFMDREHMADLSNSNPDLADSATTIVDASYSTCWKGLKKNFNLRYADSAEKEALALPLNSI